MRSRGPRRPGREMPTRGRSLPTSAAASERAPNYSRGMKNSRIALGISVMTIVPLLQLGTEYLGTGDRGRALSKLAVTLIGLPILLWGSSRGLRWAGGRRVGPLLLLAGGMLSAGTLYALLLDAVHVASFSLPILRPATGEPATAFVLRIGFAMGLTNFGLWALAFVFPFALEDARFRALEAQQLRTAAELARLRSHLEPPFLLNTLNAIAALATEDPIEERHAGRLAFQWNLGGGTRTALLPRLLLQPLVENAVNHGALAREDGGRIEVRAEVVDAKKLVCTVED